MPVCCVALWTILLITKFNSNRKCCTTGMVWWQRAGVCCWWKWILGFSFQIGFISHLTSIHCVPITTHYIRFHFKFTKKTNEQKPLYLDRADAYFYTIKTLFAQYSITKNLIGSENMCDMSCMCVCVYAVIEYLFLLSLKR